MERHDNKRRKLYTNEYQAKDGRYFLIYENAQGKKCRVYSWALKPEDKAKVIKDGKKCEYSIRELKQKILDDKLAAIVPTKKERKKIDELFEINLKSRNLRKSTADNYRYMYDKFIKPEFGYRFPESFSNKDIYDFYAGLINNNNLLPRTIENIHTMLSPIFDTAIGEKQIIVNPCNNVLSKVRVKFKSYWDFYKEDKNALTVEQQLSFMGYVKTNYPDWYNILVVFLGTGCRVGELIGLTWNDIDFDNNVIHINHQLHYGMNEQGKFEKTITPPKTKKSVRDIDLLDSVKAALISEKAKGNQCNDVVSGYIIMDKKRIEVELSDFIFLNRFGNVQLPHNTNRAFERLREKYNQYEQERAKAENRPPILLEHFSNHNLRHTYTTRACEVDGVNIAAISNNLGHADIQTTINIYNDVQQSLKNKTRQLLNEKMIVC